MGAGALPRPFSRQSGHLCAAGEGLGGWMCTRRPLGVPPALGRTLLPAPPPASSCCDPSGTEQEQLLLQAGPAPLLSLGCLQAGCWHPHRGQGDTAAPLCSVGGGQDGACGCHPFLGVKIPRAVEHSDCYKLQFVCILSVCMTYELYIFIEVKVIKSLC